MGHRAVGVLSDKVRDRGSRFEVVGVHSVTTWEGNTNSTSLRGGGSLEFVGCLVSSVLGPWYYSVRDEGSLEYRNREVSVSTPS